MIRAVGESGSFGGPTRRQRTVYLACSHRWLHAKLVEEACPSNDFALVSNRSDADVIVYLEPPWPDPEAPDQPRNFSPSELARTFVFSQDDAPIPWAPGVYASLPRRSGRTAAAFAGGFYVVHHLREPGGLAEHLQNARACSPDLLWSFVGTLKTAEVRGRIAEVHDSRAFVADTQRFSDTVRWEWGGALRDEAQEAFRRYASMLGRSNFVICPRGRGASSMRLFEALEVGRCPVIIADEWLPPPFVDWNTCSIRVRERDVEKLPEILRSRENEAAKLGRNARAIWEQFFSPERQLETLVRGCLEIDSRIGYRIRLAVGVSALGNRSTAAKLASKRLR